MDEERFGSGVTQLFSQIGKQGRVAGKMVNLLGGEMAESKGKGTQVKSPTEESRAASS